MRKISIVFLIAFLSAGSLFAGNLKFKKHNFPSKLKYESSFEAEAIYENINSQYSVTNIIFLMQIFKYGTTDLVYEKEVTKDEVASDTEYTVNFGSLDWTSLEAGVKYDVSFSTEQDFDEDPSNNSGSAVFEVEEGGLSVEEAQQAVQAYMEQNYTQAELNYTIAYMQNVLLQTGALITNYYSGWSVSLENNAYIALIDHDWRSRYVKEVTYLLVNALTGAITPYTQNFWMTIDGEFWNPNPISNQEEIVFGEANISTSGEPFTPTTDEVETVPADSVCAIIATGWDSDTNMQKSFYNDASLMEQNLTSFEGGPKLPESQIERINRATAQEIIDAIQKLRQNYSKIYFYYTGHGDVGKMITYDSSHKQLTYKKLLDELYETEADDLCLMLDCCHSGSAINDYNDDSTLTKDKNIEIYTAASRPKTALTEYRPNTEGEVQGWGFYSVNIYFCMRDSTADADMDSSVSWLEAHNWVRQQNPTYYRDSMRINDRTDPQHLVDNQHTLKSMAEALQELLRDEYEEEPENTNVHIQEELTEPGTSISSTHEEGISHTTEHESILGWIDYDKYAKFEHPTKLFAFNVLGEITYLDANWYPTVEKPNGDKYILEGDILLGTEIKPYTDFTYDPDDNPIDPPEYEDSVCAVVVSGQDERRNMEESFELDASFMGIKFKYTAGEKMLRDKDVINLDGKPASDVIDAIRKMKDKKKKIYFYYSGHGSSSGSMCMGDTSSSDGWMNYETLFKELYDTGADNLCVIVDACYAGAAKNGAYADERFSDRNVDIVTSSNAEKVSYTAYFGEDDNRKGFGAFSIRLEQCWDDDRADLDSNEHVNLGEAFQWVKKDKPKMPDGRDIDSLQCPTYTTIRKGDRLPDDQLVEFKGLDLTITNVDGIELDYEYTATMDIELHEYDWSDINITDISGNRSWTIESSSGSEDFDISLEFKLRPQFEDLEPESGSILGMVWREDESDDWKPQYPSVYDEERNVIVTETDHLSQWAVGAIVEDAKSVESKFLINNIEYGPNPFKNILNVNINIETPRNLRIEVVDAKGQIIDVLSERYYNIGTYSVNLDGSKYNSGAYFMRLISDNNVKTIKVIKE